MFSKSIVLMRCRKFESRFEDYLGGAADSELDEHLTKCEHCYTAMEDARLAGHLVRQAWNPVGEAGQEFLVGVMTRIRREEARAASGAAFWTPLEFLASRVSLTAAMVLLALSFYLVKFTPHWNAPAPELRTESLTSYLPQPPADPVSNEEVLQSLAENTYGR